MQPLATRWSGRRAGLRAGGATPACLGNCVTTWWLGNHVVTEFPDTRTARPCGRLSAVRPRPPRGFERSAERHSPDWYDQSRELVVLQTGDRLFIRCDGGPCASRLEWFPPRLEIEENDGMYVLDDDGPRDRWCYVFVPRGA